MLKAVSADFKKVDPKIEETTGMATNTDVVFAEVCWNSWHSPFPACTVGSSKLSAQTAGGQSAQDQQV